MKQSEKNKIEYEGKVFSSKSYGDFKVLKYNSTNDVEIEFIITGYKTSVALSNLKKGSVKDPYFPNIYGVGFIGVGDYSSRVNGTQPTSYKRWKEMLNRCYNINCSAYKNYGAEGVIVCDEWHNYQSFAKWYKENCPDNKFAIDKDILCKGNKVYCPEYCCFVPKDINTALTGRRHDRGNYPIGVREKNGVLIAQINYMGKKVHLGTFNTVEEAFEVYRKAKEKCLREYAELYKDVISPQVYNALYHYNIEITD